ncbi:hypothetical protein HWB02_gp162 [Klebsiella phage KNP2]|uniref:hypothetical protein n=1 Tax=Klebsiella phage KNP2 TaxID=1871716 RepID=UPI0018AD4E6F|nr:hypothetical protein HWB02_gp162 [Klebsiella phage KNP2]
MRWIVSAFLIAVNPLDENKLKIFLFVWACAPAWLVYYIRTPTNKGKRNGKRKSDNE